MMNIQNQGFEADWSEAKSHRCLVIPAGGEPYQKDIGNIFTPPGWVTWFCHEPGIWDQPEVTDMHKANFPERVHTGERGMRFFTFNRGHDGGFQQSIPAIPGEKLRFSAWAHAWSNHPLAGHDDCTGNGLCSVGVGRGPFFRLTDETPNEDRPGSSMGDSWADAVPNFTFWVGIDPTGGTDPTAGTVVWGQGAHIYNVFAQVPPVEAVAESSTVTAFLRSKTKWQFRHSDAYWDDATLEVIAPPEPEEPARGLPREQYERTYVLLPPQAGAAWARAAVEGAWDDKRYTIGGSADDAGIGDLDVRRVIAVNPEAWGPGEDSLGLRGFFEEHYEGVELIEVTARTPDELRDKLREAADPTPTRPLLIGLHDQAGGEWMVEKELEGCCLVHRQVQRVPPSLDFSNLRNAGITVICRLGWGYADGTGTLPRPEDRDAFIDAVVQTILTARGVDYFHVGNEPNNRSEWPGYSTPNEFALTPAYVLGIYNEIRDRTAGRAKLGPPPLDPYFGPGSNNLDWWTCFLDGITGAEAFFFHLKTQTNDPAEVESRVHFTDPPLTWQYLHFRAGEPYLEAIPARWRGIPVFVAEANPQRLWAGGPGGWRAGNAAWVKAAVGYARNRYAGLAFYRYDEAGDQAAFGLQNNKGVLEAIVEAISNGD